MIQQSLEYQDNTDRIEVERAFSLSKRCYGLKRTRSTALLKEMTENGFAEPITGLGKGKYRFRLHKH